MSYLINSFRFPNQGTFLSISRTGTNRLMKSDDGITWTSVSTGDNTGDYRGMVWAKDKNIIVAVGAGSGQSSYDGVNWSANTINTLSTDFQGIAYSQQLSKFITLSTSHTHRVYHSNDGITFTSGTISSRTWVNAIWADTFGMFIAAGRTAGNPSPTVVASSSDGEVFTERYISSTNDNTPGIGYAPGLGVNGRAVILPRGANSGRYSDNGTDWSNSVTHPIGVWNSIAWSPKLEMFVAVSSGVNFVASSTDGISWTTRTAAENIGWLSVTWSDYLEKFVAVSVTGTNRVMYSTNGTSWTSASAAQVNEWRVVIYTDGFIF